MNTNCIGIIYSFAYIFLVLLLAVGIKHFFKIKDEIVRKTVHILTANWWFIVIHYFDNIHLASIGPLLFIFLNSMVLFYPNIGNHIGSGDKKRALGLVYYPFSLLILVFWTYSGFLPFYAATIGVLAMGYGDGFAAIFGTLFGKKKFPIPTGGKTYVGSFVMLFVCFISSFIVLKYSVDITIGQNVLFSLIVGLVATIVEIITPLGLDNISVPLISALLVGGLF